MSYQEELEVVQDDYGYDIEGIAENEVSEDTWQAIDLTGVTEIKAIIAEADATTAKVVATASVVGDPTNGEWKFTVEDGDFDVGDVTYEVELVLTYPGGIKVTCYGATIYVRPRLAESET